MSQTAVRRSIWTVVPVLVLIVLVFAGIRLATDGHRVRACASVTRLPWYDRLTATDHGGCAPFGH